MEHVRGMYVSNIRLQAPMHDADEFRVSYDLSMRVSLPVPPFEVTRRRTVVYGSLNPGAVVSRALELHRFVDHQFGSRELVCLPFF